MATLAGCYGNMAEILDYRGLRQNSAQSEIQEFHLAIRNFCESESFKLKVCN